MPMSEEAPDDFEPDRSPRRDGADRDGPALPSELVVLVVEDDTSAQELMTWLLPSTYTVDVVATAAAARDALADQAYDLVLMDIDLEDRGSGVDVLDGMPEPVAASTPVLAVTAYAMPGDRERLLDAGFDGYLAKPFTRDRFLRAIADVLPDDMLPDGGA